MRPQGSKGNLASVSWGAFTVEVEGRGSSAELVHILCSVPCPAKGRENTQNFTKTE